MSCRDTGLMGEVHWRLGNARQVPTQLCVNTPNGASHFTHVLQPCNEKRQAAEFLTRANGYKHKSLFYTLIIPFPRYQWDCFRSQLTKLCCQGFKKEELRLFLLKLTLIRKTCTDFIRDQSCQCILLVHSIIHFGSFLILSTPFSFIRNG